MGEEVGRTKIGKLSAAAISIAFAKTSMLHLVLIITPKPRKRDLSVISAFSTIPSIIASVRNIIKTGTTAEKMNFLSAPLPSP